MSGRRIGVWFVGAYGQVATTAAAGAVALARGLAPGTGLVTSGEPFDALNLAEPGDLVFGGAEVARGRWDHAAQSIANRGGAIPRDMAAAVSDALAGMDADVTDGVSFGCGEAVETRAERSVRFDSACAARERIESDLARFRDRRRLDDLVVVNVASTEAMPDEEESASWGADPDRLEAAASKPEGPRIPASVLYAWAAMRAGCPYVNFTPSTGSSLPALQAVALGRGVPHMGQDGKTGETLLKTVLAPMFLHRRLRVLSWEGHNILGNGDGEVLVHPEHARAKLRNKDEVLRSILRDPGMHSRVRIDYVPSLGDWKTAWDFIHFEGFLGTRMSLQFTWQGCDSALAAPLVLDLVRLAQLAHHRGEKGLMPHLACFFKSPLGGTEHDFSRQMGMLLNYAASTPQAAPLAQPRRQRAATP
ncbi:MAG: inositol-3-phosphate synthase [Planctomycetes bacterium]|nr:inositol-3-phosphate synthase [Planctomycetota bacterium]